MTKYVLVIEHDISNTWPVSQYKPDFWFTTVSDCNFPYTEFDIPWGEVRYIVIMLTNNFNGIKIRKSANREKYFCGRRYGKLYDWIGTLMNGYLGHIVFGANHLEDKNYGKYNRSYFGIWYKLDPIRISRLVFLEPPHNLSFYLPKHFLSILLQISFWLVSSISILAPLLLQE